ncbi:MAG: 2OG-Fe(II) oxygenase family protein [Pseudomonadota bacterium]
MLDNTIPQRGKLNFVRDRTDLNQLTETFEQFGRVQIPEFLVSDSANKIHQALEEQSEWNLAWNNQGQHTDMSFTGVMNWTEEQRKTLEKRIHTQAEQGFQYCYSAIPIFDIYQNNLMPDHFFNEIYELFNDPGLLAMVRQITDLDAIRYTDMQATRFSKGHFLTEHDDNVKGKNRLAAFVLNLTPHWRDDWGGALIFPDQKGSESKSLFPKFNVLNIFAVPQKHLVSFVTPFAGAHRYSITGWFRSSLRVGG